MITYQLLRWESLRDQQQTQMSRTELRDLVEQLDVGIGSRLLLAGESTFGLIRFFTGLGIDITCIRETRQTPVLERVSGARPDGLPAGMPCPPSMYDAVLTCGLSSHRQSLFALEALRTTGNLASLLRPGGRLALLEDRPSVNDSEPHADDCAERHLRSFSTNVQTSELGHARRWFFSRRVTVDPRCRLTVMIVPASPLSQNGLLALANRVASQQNAACCAAEMAQADLAIPDAA